MMHKPYQPPVASPELMGPRIPKELLEWLEEAYPPRCWDPEAEPEHRHHRAAGAIALVQHLRALYEAQNNSLAEGLEADAERAQ